MSCFLPIDQIDQNWSNLPTGGGRENELSYGLIMYKKNRK